MMGDRNKSPSGVVDGKPVNSTFLVKMNFKFRSFGSFLICLGQDDAQVTKKQKEIA